MQKIKTKRAAAKRFKKLSSGKVKRSHANKSHLLTHKRRSRKNNLKKPDYVDQTNLYQLKRCLPNG